MTPEETIAASRTRIDEIDDTLLELLAQRSAAARAIGAAKRDLSAPAFHDPARERQVLERLVAKGEGRFPVDAIRAVFREVMSACLSVQEPLVVSYLGPEGTFSQIAARQIFGLQARYRECATIGAVFETVSASQAACGVVPIENSTEGAVSMTSDALLEGDLSIRQEYVLPIVHCLLSHAPSLGAIRAVFSHPQALAQSRTWLAKHLPHAQVLQTSSTAAAAREAQGDVTAAAIGAELASEIYGVPVLRRDIHARSENATRFVVVARGDAPMTGHDRTTVAFGLRDKQGALRRVLSAFEQYAVNLSRIESRPSRENPWEHVFIVDLEGHRSDPAVARAMKACRRHVRFLKVIGSYPRAVPGDRSARSTSR